MQTAFFFCLTECLQCLLSLFMKLAYLHVFTSCNVERLDPLAVWQSFKLEQVQYDVTTTEVEKGQQMLDHRSMEDEFDSYQIIVQTTS